jgi:predicted amidohydrolase YtcJ
VLIVDVEVDGRPHLDVRVHDGVITEIAARLRAGPDEPVLPGGGGALLAGLHDHHVPLRSRAASLASIPVGPPQVTDAAGFAAVLRQADHDAAPGAWLRAVGYHDSVAGPLDRWALDAVVADRPVRVQHRSGALWSYNSAALRAAGLDDATGRFWREDDRLRALTPPVALDLAAVSRRAAQLGVTGFTDATPQRGTGDLAWFEEAMTRGDLVQKVTLMSAPPGPIIESRLTTGPRKFLLDDDTLPPLDELTNQMRDAHRNGTAVAVHCVTQLQLVLTLTALDEAGTVPHLGDRIEHAGIVTPDLVPTMARLGVTVITQPNFVAERGDRYLHEVDAGEQDHLYPCGSLLRAGIAVAAGTDAPFGGPDPWAAMRAAVQRRTATGRPLGDHERVDPAVALSLFQGRADRPGTIRRVEVGAGADLCLVDRPIAAVLDHLHADVVVATVVDGTLVWSRDRR